MSDTIIKVEGLGKKYTISHEKREGYTSLRDVISNKVKGILKPKEDDFIAKEDFWALKDVNFEVKQGEAIGIIGRNGAGKSTLLKILSRITEPTHGRIELNGRVASLLEVGTGFHPELTGRENIYLNGAILGMGRLEIKKKFDEIVDFSGVEKFLDTPVKRYSSGMYVRLAFAVAAHLEPEILVVDEVLAVGDAEFQKKCLGKMNDVSRNEGRTVLFVSHNISAIQKLCTKGILLSNGRLIENNSIDNVVEQYLKFGEATLKSEYFFKEKVVQNQIAYVKKLRIEDFDGVAINDIPIGKSWRVKVVIRINEPIKQLVVGLGMLNSLEAPVRTSWNPPCDFLPGDYIVSFEEENISFSTGNYRLLVGLSIGLQSIQYLDTDIFLSFSNVVNELEDSVLRNDNGIILNQMKMYVEKDIL